MVTAVPWLRGIATEGSRAPVTRPASTTAGRMRSRARRLVDGQQLPRLVEHGPGALARRARAAPGRGAARCGWRPRPPASTVTASRSRMAWAGVRTCVGPDGVERAHLGRAERADAGAPQVGHVRPAAERPAEVVGQHPDVGARRALHLGPVDARARRVGRGVEAVDRHRPGGRAPPRCPGGPARAGGGRPTFTADTIGGTCSISPGQLGCRGGRTGSGVTCDMS